MRILYGVQATGNGHITRARALANEFKKSRTQVDFIFSGRDRANFFDMEEFGHWQCFRGLTFIHESGKLSIAKTLKQNSLATLFRDIRSLDLSPYDLVLSDFEPISAWAAKRQKKTCIGVGHQYAFGPNVPKRGDNIISRNIMQHFAPATINLGLHWHHFNHAILPPIAEVHESQLPTDPKKIVVYLGFESHADILQLIEPFNNHLFVIYGPYARYQSFGNIQLKPLSREGFKMDLATASGVICNAGFELASEAIQLGKKLLVKPLHGQMEQLSNARALEELNLGMTMHFLDTNVVKDWLANFEARRVIYPNVAKGIVDWLLHSDRSNPQALCDDMWQQVVTPKPNSLPIFQPENWKVA